MTLTIGLQTCHGIVVMGAAKILAPLRALRVMSVPEAPGMRTLETCDKMSAAVKKGVRVNLGASDPAMPHPPITSSMRRTAWDHCMRIGACALVQSAG